MQAPRAQRDAEGVVKRISAKLKRDMEERMNYELAREELELLQEYN